MNVKSAAADCLDYLISEKIPDDTSKSGKGHLYYMIGMIRDGSITGNKAHRWLGYIQGCLVVHGVATLEDMKKVNLESYKR